MEIKINDLWKEMEFDESLEEYVKKQIDRHISEIKQKTDKAIKTRIISAIDSMRKDIESSKGFAECADAKINKHLLYHHEQISEELEEIGVKENG